MRVLTIVHEQDAGPGVFAEVLAGRATAVDTWLPTEQPEPPAADGYDAIMSFGGSASPNDDQHHAWLARERRFLADALDRRVPTLGVCLGAELIAMAAGGGVRHMHAPEIGWYDVKLSATGAEDPVLGAAGERFEALEWHSYELLLPSRATALAQGANCLQAFRIGRFAWGIQFHAEVTAADFQHWLDDYTIDADAVRVGIDTDALARATEPRIAAWHVLGRGICERFLLVAAAVGCQGSRG